MHMRSVVDSSWGIVQVMWKISCCLLDCLEIPRREVRSTVDLPIRNSYDCRYWLISFHMDILRCPFRWDLKSKRIFLGPGNLMSTCATISFFLDWSPLSLLKQDLLFSCWCQYYLYFRHQRWRGLHQKCNYSLISPFGYLWVEDVLPLGSSTVSQAFVFLTMSAWPRPCPLYSTRFVDDLNNCALGWKTVRKINWATIVWHSTQLWVIPRIRDVSLIVLTLLKKYELDLQV